MADRIKNYQQEADQITTLKAIRTDLGVTPSSYTPDATVVTKDRVVTFAQAEEELVVLSDIEKGVKQQIVDVDIAEKDIANIKALLQGNLYDYQTDSSSAYTKTVPSGAMPYAGLEQIGGKTVVFNQLIDSGTTEVITLSGRKYYTLIDGSASIITSDGSAIAVVDDTEDMVIDLTLMFGVGNEPSTIDEFTDIFHATHYSYNAGELLSAGVTEVVSKDSNNATLQAYSIPAEVQALEGYGWSAGTAYNYVDFERKVFVQNVGAVDLGNESRVSWNKYNNYFYTRDTNSMKKPSSDSIAGNIVVAKYTNVPNNISPSYDKSITMTTSGIIAIRDSAFADSTVSEFITYVNGQYLYYELATPQEIDISEYLTDDNLINVEAGGTLTFENQHGDDYQIPVPSEETYMIDLQEALS